MTPPRRSSLRFTLRTLFVAVTVFGCWLDYQLDWIRQRNTVRREIADRMINNSQDGYHRGTFTTIYIPMKPRRPAPWSLRIFGESEGRFSAIGSPEANPELRRILEIFPEVRVSTPPEAPPATQVDRH
jgi:hypothetical protein